LVEAVHISLARDESVVVKGSVASGVRIISASGKKKRGRGRGRLAKLGDFKN